MLDTGEAISPPQIPKFVVSCVAETREPFLSEAVMLFKSLRTLGGAMARSDAVVYFTGPISGDVATRFGQLNVQIRIVEPVDVRCPHLNKVRMLEPQQDADYLLALDTDVVFSGDPSQLITGQSLVAKIADHDPIGIDNFKLLYSRFGLSVPTARFRTDFQDVETIPYFNSGVISIPTKMVAELKDSWTEISVALLDQIDTLPTIKPHRFFVDQMALSIAIEQYKFPFRPSPLTFNFPTHHPIHPNRLCEYEKPIILHHHHFTRDNKNLKHSPHDKINSVIDEVNNRISSCDIDNNNLPSNNAAFDNKKFWNDRYLNDPELGSGIGSRGSITEYKRALIEGFLNRIGAKSIIDVGCGDLEVLQKGWLTADYQGIDVSDVVLEKNQKLYHPARFSNINVAVSALPDSMQADAVLCFDVLIHQHIQSNYENVIKNVFRIAKRGGLISGYVALPRQQYRSHITSYHEPLTETLTRLGASICNVVGSYRDTVVVEFLK